MKRYYTPKQPFKMVQPDYKIAEPPIPVAYWEITPGPNSVKIAIYSEIGWFRRKMITFCFGWKYHKE